MNPTQIRLDARKSNFSLPVMHIYASVLLLSLFYFLLNYGSQLIEMGIFPDSHLPITQVIECGPDPIYSVVSITQNGRVSFSTLGVTPEIQAAAIQNVAAHHGITLSKSQVAELKSFPFLTISVEQIPQLLLIPLNRRTQLVESGKFEPISEAQLIEGIIETRALTQRFFERPTAISLRIDTQAKAGKIMRIINTLQNNGFSRFEYQNQI